MAWTTPVTVNPGDAILASLWNEQVKDQILASRVFFDSAVDTAARVYSSVAAGADVQVTSLDLPYAAKVADSLIVLQAQIQTVTSEANRVAGGAITQGGNIITAYQADVGGNRTRYGAATSNVNVDTGIANVYMTAVFAPGSTSSVTYGVKLRNHDGTRTLYLNQSATDTNSAAWGRTASTLFLWEVAP